MKKHSPLIKSSLFLLGIAIPCILTYKYIEQKFTDSNNLPKEEEKMTMDKSRMTAFYIEGENGEYQASSDRTFPTDGYILDEEKTTCQNGTKVWQDQTTKMINGTFKNNDFCKFYFKKEKFDLVEAVTAITNGQIPTEIKEGQPNFASRATTDETAGGLYSLEDDYGTSYYFRGAAKNNYVKFGDYYWRIIRINGDGSLRMIYDGAQAYANGTNDTERLAWQNQKFKEYNNDAKYVGYMYGPAGTTASTSKEQAQTNTESSTIKTKLEEWYVNNIKSKGLDQYVADSIFCNDRSTPGKEAIGWSSDTGLGYGTNITGYGVLEREGFSSTINYNNPKPSFICPQKNDAFTVSDIEKGNGALKEKVGLITADEIVAAGSGKYGATNTSYYLHKGNMYWSLSPCNYGDTAGVFHVNTYSGLYGTNVIGPSGVAPVINLTPEYVKTLRGEGTMSSPYTTE